MRIILKRKVHLSFSLLFTFFLFSCASSGDSSFGDSPCTDCGERGEMALEIQKEKLLYMFRQFEEDNCFECESVSNSIDLLENSVYEPKFNGGQVYEL